MKKTVTPLKISLTDKENLLRSMIRNAARNATGGRVFVAFSGGVDSSLLLWESVQALGREGITAVTAESATSIPGEGDAAREFASVLGVEHLVVETGECSDDSFLQNSRDRCYVCKVIRYRALKSLAAARGGGVVFDGTQADDDPSDRPGMRALSELDVRAPLAQSGIGKAEVRLLLEAAGFSAVAGKYAQPCLATRIPTGTPITLEALAVVRQGELFLRECGIEVVRLRHHTPIARIVTDARGMETIMEAAGLRDKIYAGLRPLGYSFVTLDLMEYGKNEQSKQRKTRKKSRVS